MNLNLLQLVWSMRNAWWCMQVAELKQQLSNEQTVHHVLERALHPASTASARSVVLNIPAFIPAKAKELLAELVLVEEEIARLESQITTMKGGLAAAQHQRASAMAVTTAHSSYPPSGYATPPPSTTAVTTAAAYSSAYSPNVHITNSNGNGNGNGGGAGGATTGKGTAAHVLPVSSRRQPLDQVAPEIKSMFFINQAMNAEYLKRHLTVTADDRQAKSPKDQSRGSGAAAGAVSPKMNNIFALPPRTSLDNKVTSQPDNIQMVKWSNFSITIILYLSSVFSCCFEIRTAA